MPGKVKVRILAGRNLPVMDKSSDTSDAFVEVKLGNTTYKTEVYRRSLNPYWNSEWFRFEVDDEELQDEPLQIRIMDYDTYSANDAIGKVYLDLNPLLSKDSGHVMSGWFPIYDTMHGIRGEINCVVKVALFSDANRYRQSSCGIKFFYSRGVPFGYTCQAILGFVEELVVNHDPEYQWIDKIRTPRASNEARQTLFSKISGEVQRRIGLKAIDLGGNAVVSYQQYFDMEGESGIVVRGIGTAVFLSKTSGISSRHNSQNVNVPEVVLDLTASNDQLQSNNLISPKKIKSNGSIPVAFLSPCYVCYNCPSNWPSRSSPSPPTNIHNQKIIRSPSPVPSSTASSRFPSSLFNKFPSILINTNKSNPKDSNKDNKDSKEQKMKHLTVSSYSNDELEAEKWLQSKTEKPFKCSLKRVASQPVTFSASCIHSAASSDVTSPFVLHDNHPLLLIRSPNVDDNLFTSYSPPLITPIMIATSANPSSQASKVGSPTKSGYGHRRLSDSDLTGTTSKGNSVGANSIGSGDSYHRPGHKFMISPESLHLLEYPFITMKYFPSNFINHIGGVVSARSVKLLAQINNPDEPETRDAWWTELRKEIRSHTRALACNAVLGYTESTYIFDEVCIMSASGTAAILKTGDTDFDAIANQRQIDVENSNEQNLKIDINIIGSSPIESYIQDKQSQQYNCSLCHIPYSETSVPFPANLVKCPICKKAKVPDVLFMTIEPPPSIPITGHGTLIQARVCRTKRETKGEQCAKEISDSLPFLEYELHRQLLTKLKVKGMNGLFSISIQVSVGDNMLIAVATGTGAYLSALPSPTPPKISSGKGVLCSKLNEIQTLITETLARNREHYNLKSTITNGVHNDDNLNDTNDYTDTLKSNQNRIDLTNGNKDSCVLLEVDDNEDADIISLMIDSDVPKGYEVCNSETLPGMESQLVCNLQIFSQVYRAKLTSVKQFGHKFDWLIQSLFVKFRRLVPCCLTDLKFLVDLPEPDLVQITVTGTAVGIGVPKSHQSKSRKNTKNDSEDSDLMFVMDEDHKDQHNSDQTSLVSTSGVPFHAGPNEHYGIELTPLSYIPGGTIDHYLGNLDFFFIRESTSIRENGGLNGFMHSFLTEIFAIVRAHVSALGGNAMIAFYLTQLLLYYNPHKNQAQCLINVAGDAVTCHYRKSINNRSNTMDESA